MNCTLDRISVAAFQQQDFYSLILPILGAHVQDKEPSPPNQKRNTQK